MDDWNGSTHLPWLSRVLANFSTDIVTVLETSKQVVSSQRAWRKSLLPCWKFDCWPIRCRVESAQSRGLWVHPHRGRRRCKQPMSWGTCRARPLCKDARLSVKSVKRRSLLTCFSECWTSTRGEAYFCHTTSQWLEVASFYRPVDPFLGANTLVDPDMLSLASEWVLKGCDEKSFVLA